MSTDLPLYNSDETDVLPQYQLSLARVIYSGQLTENDCRMFGRKVFGCGAVVYEGQVDLDRLPRAGIAKQWITLTDESYVHILRVQRDRGTVLLIPHNLWHPATKYVSFGARMRLLTIKAHRMDADRVNYEVFDRRGKSVESATVERGRLVFHDEDPFEVSVEGTVVYRQKFVKANPTEEMIELVKSDIYLEETGDGLVARSPYTGDAVVECGAIRHYVFTKKPPRAWRIW